MFVRFLGAIGTVTGSMTEMYHPASGLRFLVDCGMLQGENPEGVQNWGEDVLPFSAKALDFIILTHAHLDHIGLIPRLIRAGFEGEIRCTEATRDLTVLSLTDSLSIMKATDAGEILGKLRFNVPEAGFLAKKITITDGLAFTYLRNSHIVGSCTVQVSWKRGKDWRSIAFSGDIGINRETDAPLPLLAGQQVPYPADYTVLESTYGNRTRERLTRDVRIQGFRKLIREVVENKRIVILPCFAIQRGQEVLFDLYHALHEEKVSGEIPLIVHSSMMHKANAILAEHLCRTEFKEKSKPGSNQLRYLWMNLETANALDIDPFKERDALRYVVEKSLLGVGDAAMVPAKVAGWGAGLERYNNPEIGDAVEMLRSRGGFVVASAGMCDHGPVVEYLKQLLSDERTMVGLTGYCAPDTLGGKLLRVGTMTNDERQAIPEEQVFELVGGGEINLSTIRADIFKLDYYSGHTDQNGLIDWLVAPYRRVKASEDIVLFLVHGTDEGRAGLRDEIETRLGNGELPGIARVRTVLPSNQEQWYDLEQDGMACRGPDSGFEGDSVLDASLEKLVPFDFRGSPELEEAIRHDLVGPFVHFAKKSMAAGERGKVDAAIELAWKLGASKVLEQAMGQGWNVGQFHSAPGEVLVQAVEEANHPRIEFLCERYRFTTDELVHALEVAVGTEKRMLPKEILVQLKARPASSAVMSNFLAKCIINHVPLTASDGAVLKLLLDCGASADYVLSTGLSLLHVASIRMGSKKLLELLIEAGADPELVTTDLSQTALHLTSIGVGFNSYNHWVEQGVHSYDLMDRTKSACLMANIIMKEAPNLIYKRDALGRTALHYSCNIGSEELSLLFAKHAPELLNIEDNEGWCPVGLALGSGHKELADALVALRVERMEVG